MLRPAPVAAAAALLLLLLLLGLAAALERQQYGVLPPYFQKLQSERQESTPFLRWTEFGPGMSGYSDKFFPHPTDPNTMLVTMDMGNSYSTHDNGLSWTTTKDWDSDAEDQRPAALDFSRQDPDFGLAIVDKGLLMATVDRGRTFVPTNSSPVGQPGSAMAGVIAVDPRNDSNWYIGSGQLWRVKETHRSSVNLAGTQVPNTDYGHIFISKDRGRTWATIDFDPRLDVAKIIVDPDSSELVYAATNLGFFKSTDGGYKWQACGVGLPYNQPRDADFYYNAVTKQFILYVVEQTHYQPSDENPKTTQARGGAYKSVNRGETWHSITGNLALDLTQIHQELAHKSYYRTIGHWFNLSTAMVQQRFPELPTSTLTVFNRIVASKTRKDTIFCSCNLKHDFAFGPGEIMRTTDGASWVAVARNGAYWVNDTGSDRAYWQARGNPLGMNMKYAHLDYQMRTIDADAGVRMLVSKPDGDLITIHEQQTLRSTSHGESWAQIDDDETAPGSGHWVGRGGSNLPGITMLMETGRPEYLFASGEHGLWRGASDGESVVKYGVAVEQLTGESKGAYGATSVCSMAVHPAKPEVIYMQMFRQSFRGEIRKSTDSGSTWRNISYPIQSGSALSPNIIRQLDLMISQSNPDVLYFTVPRTTYIPWTPTLWVRNGPGDFDQFGVYRSADAGVSWEQQLQSGLPANASVARLAMDPQNSLIIYAASNVVNIGTQPRVNGGLYRTTNGGNSWHAVAIPPQIDSVNHVSIDRHTGDLYISCGEYDGEPDRGGVWRQQSADADEEQGWVRFFFMPYVTECYSSPVDPATLVVSVGIGKHVDHLNPGVYYSKNFGASWTKGNYQLDQPGRIMAIRPDLRDANILWIALYGSGWMKGIISEAGAPRAVASNLYLRSGETAQLNGSGSIAPNFSSSGDSGTALSYLWSAPATNPQLSSYTSSAPTFIAPVLQPGSEEEEYKYNLTVQSSTLSDTVQVRVIVRNYMHEPAPSTADEIGCVDLVADCGAAGDDTGGRTGDDSHAFAVCQVKAAAAAGCVTVPPGHFRCMSVAMNTSHIRWKISSGAVFSPPRNMRKSGSMFLVGAQDSEAADFQNISIAGQWPNQFIVDVSYPLQGALKGQRQGAFMFRGKLSGFSLHNVLVKLPGGLNDGIANALEFNTASGRRELSPSHGRVTNVTTTGGQWGYGLAQLQSADHIHFENLDGEGGVTLRLETGIGGGYVGEITAKNITCRNGFAAVMSEPHCQSNGRFVVEKVRSFGCSVAVLSNGGYVDTKRHPGLPPGRFDNTSQVSDVVGVYGLHAQPEEGVVDWPACAVWGDENSLLNYEVAVTNVKAVHFPPPSNRTALVHWKRWWRTHCFYNSSEASPGWKLKSDDAESTTPPAMCAAAMDRFCNGPALQRCIFAITKKGGLVPLVALFDSNPEHAASAWRCYSPSALTPNHTAYNSSSRSGLLCTEPSLAQVLKDCEHPPPPVKLVLLEDAARTKGARCLDGSPAAIYMRPGTETKKWHVHFEGGGWCFHDPPGLPEDVQCHYRAYSPTPIESRTPPRYLGSSAMLAANYSTDPPRGLESLEFLSSSPTLNPTMHNYSFAYVHYCDGASYTGDRDEPVQVQGDLLYYRGRRIRDAVMEYLQGAGGMVGAEDVVISGTSAGGLAIYLNIDQIAAQIPPPTRVRGLASAGYFLQSESAKGGYQDQMIQLAKEQNSTGALSPACLAQAAREDRAAETCFFAEHAAPYIMTPTFALQSRFDTWQLEHMSAPSPPPSPCFAASSSLHLISCHNYVDECLSVCPPASHRSPHISTSNTSGVIGYGDMIRQRMSVLIDNAMAPQTSASAAHASAAAPKHAVWLSPCETHGLGVTSYWTKSQLNDTVLSDAFDAWFGGKLDAHSRAWLGHTIGDGCK
jgi:photosystem II stability/assembly factor-like uncharacterized protein